MGGGNAQKSATKRDRNNLKKAKDAKNANRGSAKEVHARTMAAGFQCKICLSQFMGTSKPTALYQHVEARHNAPADWERAFPGIPNPTAPAAAGASASGGGNQQAKAARGGGGGGNTAGATDVASFMAAAGATQQFKPDAPLKEKKKKFKRKG